MQGHKLTPSFKMSIIELNHFSMRQTPLIWQHQNIQDEYRLVIIDDTSVLHCPRSLSALKNHRTITFASVKSSNDLMKPCKPKNAPFYGIFWVSWHPCFVLAQFTTFCMSESYVAVPEVDSGLVAVWSPFSAPTESIPLVGVLGELKIL